MKRLYICSKHLGNPYKLVKIWSQTNMEKKDKNTDKGDQIQKAQNRGGVQPIVEVVKAIENIRTEIGKEINKSEIKRAEFESWWEYTLKK